MSFDRYRVVETDNLGGDYPDESFSSPSLRRKDSAEKIAESFGEVNAYVNSETGEVEA